MVQIPPEPKGLKTSKPTRQVSVQVQRPENQEHECPKAGEDDVPAQERANLPCLCLFGPFRPSKNWIMPTCTGEGDSVCSARLQGWRWQGGPAVSLAFMREILPETQPGQPARH